MTGPTLRQPAHLSWVRAYRIVCAVLIVAAVARQFHYSVIVNHRSPFNYFSYFTIQSNLFVAALFLWQALRPTTATVPALLRGAAVLYLSITGVVYGVLLADVQAQFIGMVPWADTVLHKIIPLVIVMDWIVDPPDPALTFRHALLWLAYPGVWLVYAMVRGVLTTWYPYPFLNPSQPGGYVTVSAYCAGILAFALLVGGLIIICGQKVRLRIV